MAAEHEVAALSIIRRLTGNRWTWPPVRVREVYPLRQRLRLVGGPIRTVHSVKDYETGEDLSYSMRGSAVLLAADVCRRDREVEVDYEYGAEPPALIQRAVDALASEFELADNNDGRCRLPERVTSISRAGVSWTLIDPMTFLDNGRTGLYEVDLSLAAYGPKTRRRARISSPEYPMPDRLEVTVLEIPGS